MPADTTDRQAIETKLAAARTKLILDKPFLGALVLRLPLKAAGGDWCTTTATDARAFYYNPGYIGELSLAQTQFMLAHEALHCALSHFARRGHRIRHRWDLACDFAINPLLVEDGLTPPPNAVVLDGYRDMTAEEIYPLLDEQDETETLDQHLYNKEDQSDGGRAEQPSRPDNQDRGGKGQGNSAGNDRPPADDRTQGSGRQESTEQDDGDRGRRAARKDEGGSGEAERDSGEPSRDPPEPLTPDERETLSVQWQQRLAGAAQQALQAGKLGGSMARLVEHLLQPQVPWRTLLARFLSSLARDDFSYMRPSRREGDAIHPSLRSAQVDLVVAMDTSGSIKAVEMDEFISEINAIKGQIRARITLLPCDSCLVEGAPWLFEPWEDFTRPERIQGGGGTDFRPVFEWIRQQGMCPELLIYFTDAEGSFPPQPPEYPVLWLVKGRQRIPWGERIQLN